MPTREGALVQVRSGHFAGATQGDALALVLLRAPNGERKGPVPLDADGVRALFDPKRVRAGLAGAAVRRAL